MLFPEATNKNLKVAQVDSVSASSVYEGSTFWESVKYFVKSVDDVSSAGDNHLSLSSPFRGTSFIGLATPSPPSSSSLSVSVSSSSLLSLSSSSPPSEAPFLISSTIAPRDASGNKYLIDNPFCFSDNNEARFNLAISISRAITSKYAIPSDSSNRYFTSNSVILADSTKSNFNLSISVSWVVRDVTPSDIKSVDPINNEIFFANNSKSGFNLAIGISRAITSKYVIPSDSSNRYLINSPVFFADKDKSRFNLAISISRTITSKYVLPSDSSNRVLVTYPANLSLAPPQLISQPVTLESEVQSQARSSSLKTTTLPSAS
ncbi:uncharacterized protein LOC135499439, partial [Lineus longissimus]|uniref:uncharacterized protein LOC135499439 n=1 Tax=Lineus longissimus TaxID=88925 RepID=UPI00315D2B10